MPLYEYQCKKCGKVFEVMQKFSDAPLTNHEDCGGEVEKLLSAPAFHLKGSGWYVTDYAKGGSAKEPGKESSPESKSETKSDSSSDTKTESTKTETKTETKSSDKPAASAS